MRTNRAALAAMLGAAVLGLGTAVGAAQDATPAVMEAGMEIALLDAAGQQVGLATFAPADDGMGVEIEVQVQELAPGDHGIHVHETGACDPGGDSPFASAGGHFNPTNATHGGPPTREEEMVGTPEGAPPAASPEAAMSHAGDLGNITVGEDGTGLLTIHIDRFTLGPGETSLDDHDGSAIVVHESADDLMTDPSGESGGRIACGVIFAGSMMDAPAASPVATP